MTAFLNEVDIVNRASQLLRVPRIYAFTDHTLEAQEFAFAYPRLRDAELRAHLWRFSTRRSALYATGRSTYLWTPPTWSSATTYSLGQVVVDADGNWWQSKINSNTAQTPRTKDGIYTASSWQAYFGTDTLQPFVPATTSTLATPAAPTLSTTAGGSLGTRTEYVKITYTGAAGESAPSSESSIAVAASFLGKVTSPAASTGATGYNVYASDSTGNEVLQNTTPIAIGTDHTEPTTGLTAYGATPPVSVAPSFFAGDLTFLPSTGLVYLSIANGNTDTPPTTQWVEVDGTYAPLQFLYPIGAGPVSDPATSNVFRLPHGFLRQAPTDPKGAANPFLGAAKGNWREDWVFEGNYLVSAIPGPIMMRYVADFVDVTGMEPTFCEMLAARIAMETGARLVQPEFLGAALQNARTIYRNTRQAATGLNAIETGPIDLDLGDYIACRF